MRGQDLRQLYESHGERNFLGKMFELLNKGSDKNFRETHTRDEYLLPEDFSLKETYEALVGPVSTLNRRADIMDLREDADGVGSTAFPKLTGAVLSKQLIAGYDNTEKIGPQLVTEFKSNLKIDQIRGATSLSMPKEVLEGMAYEGDGFTDKWVQIKGKKFGRRVDVTEEAIAFDETGLVLDTANSIGAMMGEYEEQRTIEKVIDKDSDVYQPSGTAQALYSASTATYPYGINLKTSNALVDQTDLKNARLLLAAMKRDDNTTPIGGIKVKVVLVPDDLVETAFVALNSVMTPASGNGAINSWGPQGLYRPQVLTSPYATAVSTTAWFMGDPQRQFKKKVIWPIQVFRARSDSEEAFGKDIVVSVKVRYYFDIGATDTRHFVKSTA